jgi:hypothetical protein
MLLLFVASPLTLPSPPAYRQAGAGERDGVRGTPFYQTSNKIYRVLRGVCQKFIVILEHALSPELNH